MIEFQMTITGVTPLLMHNSRLADPTTEAAKNLRRYTSIPKKSQQDHEDVARAEWLGGIYHDAEAGPYMPGANIARALRDGAAVTARGAGKLCDRGLRITTEVNPLAYKGPRDLEGLRDHGGFIHRAVVKNQSNKVSRTRPMFREWACDCEGWVDPNQLNLDKLQEFATAAGKFVGLGDWRPGAPKGGTYGQFKAEVAAL